MSDEYFQFHLENLKKLHADLEKQMQNFDEVVPFERQRTAQIYSPRLLNMMLVCGAQIEAITRLISDLCHFPYDNIRDSIRKINEKIVLAKFEIVSIPHKLLFTPFTRDLEWWVAYNELKHELEDKQFKITYTTVMNAFAVLSALHCLAEQLVKSSSEDIPKILDHRNWKPINLTSSGVIGSDSSDLFWKSLLFEIRNYYFPVHLESDLGP